MVLNRGPMVQLELDCLVKNMGTAIEQARSTVNNLVDGTKTTPRAMTALAGVRQVAPVTVVNGGKAGCVLVSGQRLPRLEGVLT